MILDSSRTIMVICASWLKYEESLAITGLSFDTFVKVESYLMK